MDKHFKSLSGGAILSYFSCFTTSNCNSSLFLQLKAHLTSVSGSVLGMQQASQLQGPDLSLSQE